MHGRWKLGAVNAVIRGSDFESALKHSEHPPRSRLVSRRGEAAISALFRFWITKSSDAKFLRNIRIIYVTCARCRILENELRISRNSCQDKHPIQPTPDRPDRMNCILRNMRDLVSFLIRVTYFWGFSAVKCHLAILHQNAARRTNTE